MMMKCLIIRDLLQDEGEWSLYLQQLLKECLLVHSPKATNKEGKIREDMHITLCLPSGWPSCGHKKLHSGEG